jgi:flavin reductase (DIM6/NTAB) family NADH-FMN oxidoreductase RutF
MMDAASVVRTAPPDPALMREALGQFASGVTVITTLTAGGAPAGCTVSAFCSLSMDPPLVLACLDRTRHLRRLITLAPGFAVNVLRADQRDVALRFARPGGDRFAALPVAPGRHGIPLLDDAIAHIECDHHSVMDGGDHVIVVGRVRGLAVRGGEPLLYAQGAFLDMPRPEWERMLVAAPREWLLSAPW